MVPTVDRDGFTAAVADRVVAWRRVAFLMCGDWGRAEDVVQVALLRLYRRWSRIEPDGLEGYARQLIARLVIDQARIRRRRPEIFEDAPDRPAAQGCPDAVLDVRAALAQVPIGQRTVLVLRFYCELSVAETATTLGISTGTVKSQCARGLQTLRVTLDEPDLGELSPELPRWRLPSAERSGDGIGEGTV